MDDQDFRLFLDALGLSWPGYRKVRKGVKKRIARHMQELGCHTMRAYLAELHRSPAVRQASRRLATVSISRFFRDRQLWAVLENDLLPDLISTANHPFFVWSAGCACGEEVYSFLIVWERLKNRLPECPELQVVATDMNPVYLARARAGSYTASSLKEVDADMREQYFKTHPDARHYTIRTRFKRQVLWREHNLLSEPPGSRFDLIFLRNNLLTYYQDQYKIPAFRRILDVLRPGGLLIVGAHEKIPQETRRLKRLPSHPHILRKPICTCSPD